VLFPPALQKQWDEQAQQATEWSKGHGRLERRTIITTPWLNEYLEDWPGVGQVFRLERERKVKGKVEVEVVYGLTSLSSVAADAQQLLGYTRGHWGIENGLHYIRDETLGEDRCRVRRGQGARVLASMRNVAVHLLKGTEYRSVAGATRAMSALPELALNLLNDTTSISE
jgi:predicted transposase YbfD/YdcC